MNKSDDLAGQVAVVTGAGRGIGARYRERLASLGATAVLCGRTAQFGFIGKSDCAGRREG